MFSREVVEFITGKMKIELSSIVNKLDEPELLEFKEKLTEMIEYCVFELIRYEPNRVVDFP